MEPQPQVSGPSTRFPLVSELLQSLRTAPIVVTKNTWIMALPDLVSGNRGCRTIAVVDESGVLVGIIPVAVLLQDLLLGLLPEEFLGDLLELDKAVELAKERHARTAGELMHPPVFIVAEDGTTARDALHKLHQAGLEGLPVVDKEGRVIGYFDSLEFMMSWWQTLHPKEQ